MMREMMVIQMMKSLFVMITLSRVSGTLFVYSDRGLCTPYMYSFSGGLLEYSCVLFM